MAGIKVSLIDNTIQEVPSSFLELSNFFNTGNNHIHTNLETFKKFKEFGIYFLSLDKKERKIFDNPEQIWEKENISKNWCETFLGTIPNHMLIELLNVSSKVNVKQLLDLCCYQLAQLIKSQEIDEIKEMFKGDNEFTPEELKQLNDESDWV